jgi:predicted dithiol-disulfide oxidoreductase (DUF899 family)
MELPLPLTRHNYVDINLSCQSRAQRKSQRCYAAQSDGASMSTNSSRKQTMQHSVVSREEWLAARKTHLKNEKALTRLRDLVAAERRALPWVKVEKQYVFDTAEGKRTLAQLFEGRSQLIVYHFMWRWDLGQGCASCSFFADHVDGANIHLANHDVTFVAISRGRLADLEAYRKRLGWRFKLVSSYGSDFNYDYHVSFTKDELAHGKIYYNYATIEDEKYLSDELPGFSVFYKDESGEVFHTYSSYARGGDLMLGAYNFLDLTPKGRNEREIMDWVRRNDEYETGSAQTHCHAQTRTSAA